MYRALFRIYFQLHDFIESRFFYHVCKWLRQPHPKNLYDYRTRVFLEHLGPRDRVADLGCGTGKLVLEMSSVVDFALGVDLNRPLLLKDPATFVQLDVLSRSLPVALADRQINTITLSHVLEHIADPVDFLSRLSAFQKILICVPSQENWRFQFKQSLGLDARTDPTHYREYTIAMLRDEAARAGLNVKSAFYNSEGEIFAVCGA